jgi:vancomycin resistance protein YoaR
MRMVFKRAPVRKKKCIFLTLIFLVAVTVIFADYCYYKDRIYPGVYLKNVHLGGMTDREVDSVLGNTVMTLISPGGQSTAVPLRKMGIIFTGKYIYSSGYRQGRLCRWPLSYIERFKLLNTGYLISMQYHFDPGALQEFISSFEHSFNKEPQNAYFFVNTGGNPEIRKEIPGYHLDKQLFEDLLLHEFSQAGNSFTLTVPIENIPAEINAASLREIVSKEQISSFTTAFDPAKTDRVHNIKLASKMIDNTLLAPGEIFSLNSVIGDTTTEKGYREAPIILGGELVPGVGGGLCQISTTLYNTALLANLEIIERYNHLLTVPYISPGRDATVAYPSKDLKFRNNTNQTMLILAKVDQHELTFSFFGRPMHERVEINTKIINTIRPPIRYELAPHLFPGEVEETEGSPGYLVEVWKTVYRDDKVESRQKISVDSYLPYPTIIRHEPKDDT